MKENRERREFKETLRQAGRNDPEAQFRLGLCYKEERGVGRNP